MKKTYFSKIILLIGVFICSGIILAPKAHAANGVQISPLTFELNSKPGGQQNGTIIIKNTSNDEINYSLESENFNQISDQGEVNLETAQEENGIPNSLAHWITFESNTGVLAAGESKHVNFNINVPADASPGGHYAAIFVKNTPKSDPNAQITVANRVGSLILLTIDGQMVKTGTLSDFSYPHFIKTLGSYDLSAKINNTGNVYYKSSAKVEIKNLFGKVQTIDLGSHIITNGNSRLFSANWNNKFPFGRYVVTFTSTDGNGNALTAAGIIWAFPWQLVVPIVVIIIALIILIVSISKKGDKQPANDVHTNKPPRQDAASENTLFNMTPQDTISQPITPSSQYQPNQSQQQGSSQPDAQQSIEQESVRQYQDNNSIEL